MRTVILFSALLAVTNCFGQFRYDRKCNTTFDFGLGFQVTSQFVGPSTSVRAGYKHYWIDFQYHRGQRIGNLESLNIQNQPLDFIPLGDRLKSDIENFYPEHTHDAYFTIGWRTMPRSWGWAGLGAGLGWSQINQWDYLTLLQERNSVKALAFNKGRDLYKLHYKSAGSMLLLLTLNTQFSINKWLALYVQGSYLINFSGNSRPAISAGLRFGKMY